MKQIKFNLSALCIVLSIALHAQKAITTGGGNATGSGGTLAYSVGQIDFTTNTSSEGSLAQGVQQPYEISVVSGTEAHQIRLYCRVYPNPATDLLTLHVDNPEYTNLYYQLLTIQGSVLEQQQILQIEETIRMDHLPVATYILQVNDNEQTLKSFKIIKH